MSIFNPKKYLIAISGGPDSMALLYFFKNYIKVACVVNYHKRVDADHDVELVKHQCAKYKIPVEVYDVPLSTYENQKENFQALARKIRYDFFKKTAKKYGVDTVLTAHHFDDWLETAYMQKMKKSKALVYGMAKKSTYEGIKVYRPFLFEFRKKTLQRMCDEYKLPYAIDVTNELDIYERNRVRKIIQDWPTETVYAFKKEIFKYNKGNKKQAKQNQVLFNKFLKNECSINFYHQLNQKQKYYLIYNLLNYWNKQNRSSDKIDAIMQFLDANSQKHFRLDDNSYLKIKKHKIEYVEHQ